MKEQICMKCILILTCATVTTVAVSTPVCPPGQYREVETNKCRSCSGLCQLGSRSGSVNECTRYCPDYAQQLSENPGHSCPDGSYYDINLSKCDRCSNICDQHRIQGTSSSCEQHCPKEYAPPLCDQGSYYDSNLPGCDLCSSVCDKHDKMGTTADCKKYCPQVYNGATLNRDEKEENTVAVTIGCTVGGVLVLIAVICLILFKCRRRQTEAPLTGVCSEDPDSIPHPTVSYVKCPLHVQCVDSCTISASSSTEAFREEERSGIEEEQKFPMAHADLPYSARPLSASLG